MERLSMRKIKEVLRLKWGCALSNRAVADSCAIAPSTVLEYVRRATRAGLAWPLPEGLGDAELEARMFAPVAAVPGQPRPLPQWPELHQELRRKGMTLFLLWQEYKAIHPEGYQYSQFCERYRQWAGTLDVCLRQEHKAGEKMFVDWAGQSVPVTDPSTGQTREAQIFVAVLGASNYTYVEATWTQALPDWIAAHIRAWEAFGGVSHPRSFDKGRHTSVTEHMPKSHREYLEWTPERLVRWAAKSGPATAALAEAILAGRPHPLQGYRSCLGVMRLGKTYGAERLEAACVRALAIGATSYRSVESILKTGLDRRELPEKPPPRPALAHANVRGSEYYEEPQFANSEQKEKVPC